MRDGFRVAAGYPAACLLLCCLLPVCHAGPLRADHAVSDPRLAMREIDPPPVPPIAPPTADPDLDALRRRLRELEDRLDRAVPQPAAPHAVDPPPAPPPQPLPPAVLPSYAPWESVTIRELETQTRPSHTFRGRILFDHVMVEDYPGHPLENFTGFATARLGVMGHVHENVRYTFEMEFVGEETRFKDVYGELQQLPWVGNLRVGHYFEPMGLAEVTGIRFGSFHRTSVASGFAPGRNMGLMLHGEIADNPNLHYFLGAFRGGSSDNRAFVQADANDLAITGRIVWLPFYDEPTDGRYLLHLGASASNRRTGAGTTSRNGLYGGSLELGNFRSPITASLPDSEEFNVLATELAWINGPLHVTHELFYLDAGGGTNAWGTFVEAGYFLTGESRGYNRQIKTFGRTHPFENFFAVRTPQGVCRGWGAWQVLARWSWADLSNPNLQGTPGTQENLALGLNWFLNPYCRVQVNYVHGIADPVAAAASRGDHVGIRFQVDW